MRSKIKYIGISSASISAIAYGLAPILINIAYRKGMDPTGVMFYRCLCSLPLLFIFFRLTKSPQEHLLVGKQACGKLLVLGLSMVSCNFLLYASYMYLSAGMSTTLHFIYPVLINVACILLFREKVTPPKLLSLALATVGVAMLTGNELGGNFSGIILALLSGVCYAFYMVYMDRSGLGQFSPFLVAFYEGLVGCFSVIVRGTIQGTLSFQISGACILLMMFFAFLDFVVANVMAQISIRSIGPSVTAIFSALEPITSVLLGILILKEPITTASSIGTVCVVGSILIITGAELEHGKHSADAEDPPMR